MKKSALRALAKNALDDLIDIDWVARSKSGSIAIWASAVHFLRVDENHRMDPNQTAYIKGHHSPPRRPCSNADTLDGICQLFFIEVLLARQGSLAAPIRNVQICHHAKASGTFVGMLDYIRQPNQLLHHYFREETEYFGQHPKEEQQLKESEKTFSMDPSCHIHGRKSRSR